MSEGFEAERFPPAGWTLEFDRPLYWGRYLGASGYGVGSGSARFDFFLSPAGTSQSLVLSSLGSTVPGDSLSFDHAYATYQSEVDRLVIETSTDGGITYVELITLSGGRSGSLVTAPPEVTPFVPSASEWATKRYALPVGTNRVRFRAVGAYGNCLYLDNVGTGAQAIIDAGVQSIDIASPTLTIPQVPKITVKNHGATAQTFSVALQVSPGGYSSVRSIADLPAGGVTQVSFDGWTPATGVHTATAFTSLAGDLDSSNDTARSVITVDEARQVSNVTAFSRDGQVFITWDNLPYTNVKYTLHRSPNLIRSGHDLAGAENLGDVRDSSSLDRRLTNITGTPTYLKTDSASIPLAATQGLFVATSTSPGSFYYAVTTNSTGTEDTSIIPGANSLLTPVDETVMTPRPVWQGTRVISGKTFEVYVQYTTRVTSSSYPQMTNAGSFPHHFAIVKSGIASPHPITYWMHGGGLSFLSATSMRTTGDPGEWVVTIDDWNPTIDEHTFFYGFHEDYDLHADVNPIPGSGSINNYTAARVAFTIDWALKNLPLDATRTYMTGWSMGGIGSLFNSILLREKIAAIFIYAPRVDMSTWGRDRLWGTYETNLPTNEDYSRNERLNAMSLLSQHRTLTLPLMFTFCGRRDIIVGWPEKIAFYDTLVACRQGGAHFWSNSDHTQVFWSSPWQPSFPNFSFMTRYRTNVSYPAFSNCSADDNPGDGTASGGDLIGALNGHLEWADDIVDLPDRWEITLYLKELRTASGWDPAPDSALVDVTLRRLQAFSVPAGHGLRWENRKKDQVVQSGWVIPDDGLLTLPEVTVYKDSSRLVAWPVVNAAAEHQPIPLAHVLEQNYPNPFNSGTTIRFTLADGGLTIVSVYDILGRKVASLVNEVKEPGTHEVRFDASGLASGLYVYRLNAGAFTQARAMTVLK